jgi:hypothetical protein
VRRFRVPEIVLGFLSATAFWALVAVVYPDYYGSEQSPNKNAAVVSAPKPPQEAEVEINQRIANYNRTLDWLTAFLVIANIALWWATWRGSAKHSRDMEAALAHAEKALATGERAFVFIDGFNVEMTTAVDSNRPGHDFTWLPERYQQDPSLWIARFAAQPRWKNGGNTPTNQLTVQANWGMFREGIPPNIEYTYRDQPAPFFLGPRAVEPSPAIEIPPVQALINWANNPAGIEPIILIWGRADYRDVFDAPHFVEWCYWLRLLRPIPQERMAAQFIQWGQYNRTDQSG